MRIIKPLFTLFLLLAVGILYAAFPGKMLVWAGKLFITGMILFSGSLYVLCYVKYNEMTLNWIGAITPFGGAAFIAGWVLLFLGVVKRN